MTEPTYRSRVEGCLYGLALGDALGAPTEFMKYAAIVETYGPLGPEEPSERVTDDTQMALAVGEALMSLADLRSAGGEEWSAALGREFLAWLRSLDNNRAPGQSSMDALSRLEKGGDWRDATEISSKGCGANMRVQPVGLLTDKHGFSVKKRAKLAQLQAAITHGHPTALAASELTAHAIHLLIAGLEPEDLPTRLAQHADQQRGVYYDDTLGELWEKAGASGGAAYMNRGWNDVANSIEKLARALKTPDRDADPGLKTGHGWTAEEALATALHCFLLYVDDPVLAIRRAAATGGDSDSIACITGALAGAYHGNDAWPHAWRDRIEYKDRIQKLADWY
ncbi:MAG: ADP-ribosylglycohydrolase family protein [Planctomycetes bacterium]|nr:ADP-ribosylglycohydrolase family protein [Planctomycetota bacterium]